MRSRRMALTWRCARRGTLDGGLRIDFRVKASAANALARQHGEEILDGVQPRSGRWSEVKVISRMAFEPRLHVRMLVGRLVVGHCFD